MSDDAEALKGNSPRHRRAPTLRVRSGACPAVHQLIAVVLLAGAILGCSSASPEGGSSRTDEPVTVATAAPDLTTLPPNALGTRPTPRPPVGGGVAATGDEPALVRLTLAATGADGSGNGNGWGPNISRLVRTSTGDLYTTVLDSGRDPYHRRWRLLRLAAGAQTWSDVAVDSPSRADVYNPPAVLRGPADQLYVVAWPNMQPVLWSAQSNRETAIPGSWYVNQRAPTGTQESSYGAASIGSDGALLIAQAAPGCNACDHENRPGYVHVAARTPSTQNWTGGVYQTAFRHAYLYLLPEGSQALTLAGSLDARYAELGFADPPGASGSYAFNGVRLWQLEAPDRQPAGPLLVRQETPDRGCATVRAFASDVYEDLRGRVHVLYDLLGPSTGCIYTGRHAVIENGRVIADVALAPAGSLSEGVPFSNFSRIIQDRSGVFYVFSVATPPEGGTACVMYLQRGAAGDTDGTNLEPRRQLLLSRDEDCGQLQNHFIAAPRGGSGLEDYVDGVLATGGGARWFSYRLCLRGCAASGATSMPGSAAPAAARTPGPVTPVAAGTPNPTLPATPSATVMATASTLPMPPVPSGTGVPPVPPTGTPTASAGTRTPTATPARPSGDSRTATLLIDPPAVSVRAGETFSLAVYLSGNGTAVSEAAATIRLGNGLSLLEVQAGSCAMHFSRPPSAADPSFAGSLEPPNGQGCVVMVLVLAATAPGNAAVSFSDATVTGAEGEVAILKATTDGVVTAR